MFVPFFEDGVEVPGTKTMDCCKRHAVGSAEGLV